MKNLIVKTMDAMMNTSLVLLAVMTALSLMGGGGVWDAAMMFLMGLVVITLVFGFWALVGSILEEQKTTNKLLKALLEKE